jgi:tRNA A-37 threonylcarbamoyl transferase component Bud32/energy-coupling factor transporter ATP-binding protein EcfA2
MLLDRTILGLVADQTLANRALTINWQGDSRSYTLIQRAGIGKTGVAWKVRDGRGRTFAVKFVLKADYGSHSLDAEATRTDSLSSRLFAKIDFFGEPTIFEPVDCGEFYAIVVEWVEGRSLNDFILDSTTIISPDAFLRLARDLCESLQSLKEVSLSHSDLHGGNILVRRKADPLATSEVLELVVIDTGQLKTEKRRAELLEHWQEQLSTVESLQTQTDPHIVAWEHDIRRRLTYFARTDQEWIVCHLCSLYNRLHDLIPSLDVRGRRFVRESLPCLRLMVDVDPSRRLDDPRRMYLELEGIWSRCSQPQQSGMISPFDLPSAELIRSDRQLMALFSDEYPRLDACRSAEPIYLYGPRGCGKSTILRSLSLKAILECEKPADEFAKSPFVGVYLSASQDLRSRFWLMQEADFAVLEAHLVRYFNLLLIESLTDTLDAVYRTQRLSESPLHFQMTDAVARDCAAAIQARVSLPNMPTPYVGQSYFSVLRNELRRARDDLWISILDRNTPKQRTDAQLLFDLCHDLENRWAFLREYRLVFLIDDYSNQRIPAGLQRRLNQAITFSKQGSPIFKVTSEYQGVDLEGVEEGREVHEVNVGSEYVSLQVAGRYRFLQSVLERRFQYLKQPVDLTSILSLSEVEPAIAMAREIRAAVIGNRRFLYHGIDTISDLCSGDFAMGIDLVRRIFEHAGVDWRNPTIIAPSAQDRVIRDYAKHEFEYIRYHSRNGRIKFLIVDRLCWLSKECILTKTIDRSGASVPVVKNHIDISETALRHLHEQYPEKEILLNELLSRGVLFPLQTSRARKGRDATFRVMVRRILLAQYTTALGRDQAIRIDDVQRLQYLLTEPEEFVKDELRRIGGALADSGTGPSDRQLKLDLPEITDG